MGLTVSTTCNEAFCCHRASERRGVLHNLVHREAAAQEARLRALVAVARHVAGGAVFVDPGGAPRQQQEVQRGQGGGGGTQAAVDAPQGLVGRGGGEVAVVHRAVPEALVRVEVGRGIDLARQHLAQGGGDGQGIVEHAVGIGVATEAGFLQPRPDVCGEARPHQHQPVGIADGGAQGGTFDGGQQFHCKVGKISVRRTRCPQNPPVGTPAGGIRKENARG